MTKSYTMNQNEKEKRKKGFFSYFKSEQNNRGGKESYRKKEDTNIRVMNSSGSRSRRFKQTQERIYDEIDLGLERISSAEEMHKNDDQKSAVSDETNIKSKSRFQVEKVTEIINSENNYDQLTNLEKSSINDSESQNNSGKKSPKIVDEEPENKSTKKNVNFNADDFKFQTNLNKISSSSLENINKIRARGRSKSAFVPKAVEPEEHQPKRRAIIDVIKKLDVKDVRHTDTITHKPTSFHKIEDHSDKVSVGSGEYEQIRADETLKESIQTFNQQSNEKKANHHEIKEPMKGAVGVSIIYGLVLCFLGIFISLDSLAGKLGESRVVNTAFTAYLFVVGIFGLIYAYIDYRKYINALNKIFERKNINDPRKFNRKKSHSNKLEDIYSVSNVYGEKVDLYATREYYVENIGKPDDLPLVDFSSKYFNGYLVDKNQPFNMYLKVGIGIFCVFTLLQCGIVIAEAIENYTRNKTDCFVETNEAVISILQFIFTCLQFLYIFLRGNIVNCRKSYWPYLFTMHMSITNLIVWFKYILIESVDEYYEHYLHETLGSLKAVSVGNFTEYDDLDCHSPEKAYIKKFVLILKPYIYPGTIEFSVTCATIFIILWTKTGDRKLKAAFLPPTKQNFQDVGMVKAPSPNVIIILDCSKTSKGVFYGVLTITATILSVILYFIYFMNKPPVAKLITEITEITLLTISLLVTLYAGRQIKKNYSKGAIQMNMFDIVLEVFSLCGVLAYSINNLIAIIYGFSGNKSDNVFRIADTENKDLALNIPSAIAALLQMCQGIFQTLFILECLRRIAEEDSPFIKKPGRDLITLLLVINASMWFFDTLSAKRLTIKSYLIDHFGILKWSIINAFSAPIAIFYRFHSSVCLSDIWHGLYYGEFEEYLEEQENEEKI